MTLYHPTGLKQKDVSTRLIKPTLPDIDLGRVLHLVKTWSPEYEYDGNITVYDEGIAQYYLCDQQSHDKFYAALILNKPSLRCSLSDNEPEDLLDELAGNRFTLNGSQQNGSSYSAAHEVGVKILTETLAKRGYKF